MDEDLDELYFLCPKSDEPGLAVTLILNRGLELPLGTNSCRSAFDYPAELQRHGISPEHWQRFTETIFLETGLLCHQCTTVIGRDPDTLAIGGVIVGILGAVPAFFVARTAQHQRSLIAGLAGDRGIVIRLDLLGGHWNHLEGMRFHAITPSSCSEIKSVPTAPPATSTWCPLGTLKKTGVLTKLGLEVVPEDPYVFTIYGIIVFFYVDDILITSHPLVREKANQLEKDLEAYWELTDHGEVEWFSNIRIIRDRQKRKLWLC
ncbi:hypothetical protein PEBR_07986 [Penicillium brasilianum]|uniref:Reverse transcriptase Ty1/copia-type domain-containing protein n=1 Tax=Penicillium brasilianum TaxID=104259 RepID=A0A1S9RVH4_PENBI|nr:hypothetical protein PEBR_07986 [Penicillium brasilianum]